MGVQTKSIMLQCLSVPCACRCRYCLLSWDGKCVGCDFDRGMAYAKAFHDWITETHPEIRFHFSFGYSMDHPRLLPVLDFLNGIGSVSGSFLQMNGFAFRDALENMALVTALAAHGVKSVNFTFYGTEKYHDAFAGRQGDFSHLLSMAYAAVKTGLRVSAGIPLTQENCPQTEKLLSILSETGISDIRLFIPHEEGRGIALQAVRCTKADYERLSPFARKLLNRAVYRTEAEWIADGDPEPESSRSLLISLTPGNIAHFEKIGFEQAIREVEALDEAYYSVLPDFQTLLGQYGDPANTTLYGRRDLYQRCQKQYIREHCLSLYDVTDERFCGSRRY